MKYVSLDFETCGKEPGRHAPVQLGVALMEDGEAVDCKEWIIAPPRHYKTNQINREYDIVALSISGLTWNQIIKGTSIARVCFELDEWSIANQCEDLPVVAYNSPFDLPWYSDLLFLGGSYDRALGVYRPFNPPLIGPWQCALMLARKALNLPSYRLDEVAAKFGMCRSGENHGALEDAILAGKIYHALTATN